jgi:UDP-glucose 4-epimerase
MEINGKSFLITGGAGFIGSHLVDELLKHDVKELRICDSLVRGRIENLNAALKDSRVKYYFEKDGDIKKADNCKKITNGIDGIFHLVSRCLGYCQDNPKEAYETNVMGMFNLLEACIKNKVKRLIHSSSSSVYGNALYSPMDEEHPFMNKNIYGATKIACEAMIKSFYHKYGLPYLGLRYMNVYGPRQDYLGVYVAVIIKIIDNILKNESPVIHGDGSQAFDFVYVKDVCRANIIAMTANQTDTFCNISSGIKTSILELCKTIMGYMNSELPIKFLKVDTSTLVVDRIGSTDKAEKELGFKVATLLAKGLAETIDWKKLKEK